MGRRLYRSESDKMIAGVCGGLGEYFNIDATIVRLIFALIVLYGGSGIILYIILWIVVPTKSQLSETPEKVIQRNSEEIKEKVSNAINKIKSDTKKK